MRALTSIVWIWAAACVVAVRGEGSGLNDNDTEYNDIFEIENLFLPDGEPNCLDEANWNGSKFRHLWYTYKYWTCDETEAVGHVCDVPMYFQESLQTCVFPWHWHFDPIPEPQRRVPDENANSSTEKAIIMPSACDAPRCDGHYANILQASHSPYNFYQCTPAGPVRLPCTPGMRFSYAQQMCVNAVDWLDYC